MRPFSLPWPKSICKWCPSQVRCRYPSLLPEFSPSPATRASPNHIQILNPSQATPHWGLGLGRGRDTLKLNLPRPACELFCKQHLISSHSLFQEVPFTSSVRHASSLTASLSMFDFSLVLTALEAYGDNHDERNWNRKRKCSWLVATR